MPVRYTRRIAALMLCLESSFLVGAAAYAVIALTELRVQERLAGATALLATAAIVAFSGVLLWRSRQRRSLILAPFSYVVVLAVSISTLLVGMRMLSLNNAPNSWIAVALGWAFVVSGGLTLLASFGPAGYRTR
jgi:hypothetical protein